MNRKIYNKIKDWKEKSNGKTALLIDGARRVGKSYIAEEFGKNNYKSYILIDFNKVDDDFKSIFDKDLDDLDSIFEYICAYYNKTLFERDSLIILDEIQLCPRARAAIKFLVADGRYDYIETGSLISIKNNTKDIVIPSEERHIKMYPMDFEEFLWALKETEILNYIKSKFNNKQSMGNVLHRKAMKLFRKYMMIGGMPLVVQEYVRTKDLTKVDLIKQDILSLYIEDIEKHTSNYEEKVMAVFDQIPEQLSKHERKFVLTSLGANARYREYEAAFAWLEKSMIVNICYNADRPTVGLKLNRDHTKLKVYMGDTGLLISYIFNENGEVDNSLYNKLILNKLEVDEGMLFENMVAQMLVASNHKLYFYSNASKKDAKERMEIDFLYSINKLTNRHNISIVEVKSGKRNRLSSLKKFISKFNDQIYVPYVVCSSDLEIIDGITYIPIYMAFML